MHSQGSIAHVGAYKLSFSSSGRAHQLACSIATGIVFAGAETVPHSASSVHFNIVMLTNVAHIVAAQTKQHMTVCVQHTTYKLDEL
jgi:hypothetical protein